MPQPLGNPEDQTPIAVTQTPAEIIVENIGFQSIEFVNTGRNDCFYGKLSTLTSVRGAPIFSQGGRRTFENIQSGWKISFVCKTGKTTTLRRINYV